MNNAPSDRGHGDADYAVAVVVMLAILAVRRCSEKVRKLYRCLRRRLFWNAFIRYFLHGTLKLQISAVTVVVLATSSQTNI